MLETLKIGIQFFSLNWFMKISYDNCAIIRKKLLGQGVYLGYVGLRQYNFLFFWPKHHFTITFIYLRKKRRRKFPPLKKLYVIGPRSNINKQQWNSISIKDLSNHSPWELWICCSMHWGPDSGKSGNGRPGLGKKRPYLSMISLISPYKWHQICFIHFFIQENCIYIYSRTNIYNKISPKTTKVDMKLSHDDMIINFPYCKNERKALKITYILVQKSAWFKKLLEPETHLLKSNKICKLNWLNPI